MIYSLYNVDGVLCGEHRNPTVAELFHSKHSSDFLYHRVVDGKFYPFQRQSYQLVHCFRYFSRVDNRTEIIPIVRFYLFDKRVEYILLALEMLIKGRSFYSRFFRNKVNSHTVIAFFRKQSKCRIQYPVLQVQGVRSEIAFDIDRLILSSENFDELLEKLKEIGYEIKDGKYLAVKSPRAQRFVRLRSLGDVYLALTRQQFVNALNAVRNNPKPIFNRRGYIITVLYNAGFSCSNQNGSNTVRATGKTSSFDTNKLRDRVMAQYART